MSQYGRRNSIRRLLARLEIPRQSHRHNALARWLLTVPTVYLNWMAGNPKKDKEKNK